MDENLFLTFCVAFVLLVLVGFIFLTLRVIGCIVVEMARLFRIFFIGKTNRFPTHAASVQDRICERELLSPTKQHKSQKTEDRSLFDFRFGRF